jgi:hypothetical protein
LRDVSSHEHKCSTTCYITILASQSNSQNASTRPAGNPSAKGWPKNVEKRFVLCPPGSTKRPGQKHFAVMAIAVEAIIESKEWAGRPAADRPRSS